MVSVFSRLSNFEHEFHIVDLGISLGFHEMGLNGEHCKRVDVRS